jgi:hypothetical protein
VRNARASSWPGAGVLGRGLGRSRESTPIIDRHYFHSIYFREPSGVLFEIADDGPGFRLDAPMEELGTKIILPPRFEPMREEIEVRLSLARSPGGLGEDAVFLALGGADHHHRPAGVADDRLRSASEDALGEPPVAVGTDDDRLRVALLGYPDQCFRHARFVGHSQALRLEAHVARQLRAMLGQLLSALGHRVVDLLGSPEVDGGRGQVRARHLLHLEARSGFPDHHYQRGAGPKEAGCLVHGVLGSG